MRIVEILKYLSENYEKQLTTEFKGNEFRSNFIKNAKKAIPEHLLGHNLEIKASTGQGNWAFYPWITIYDKSITSSPQKGYYVVFLFTNDYKEVYLSLNQGWMSIAV